MREDLELLASKLGELTQLVQTLRNENQQLRAQIAEASRELDAMRRRVDQASSRLDALLQRLPPGTVDQVTWKT